MNATREISNITLSVCGSVVIYVEMLVGGEAGAAEVAGESSNSNQGKY